MENEILIYRCHLSHMSKGMHPEVEVVKLGNKDALRCQTYQSESDAEFNIEMIITEGPSGYRPTTCVNSDCVFHLGLSKGSTTSI